MKFLEPHRLFSGCALSLVLAAIAMAAIAPGVLAQQATANSAHPAARPRYGGYIHRQIVRPTPARPTMARPAIDPRSFHPRPVPRMLVGRYPARGSVGTYIAPRGGSFEMLPPDLNAAPAFHPRAAWAGAGLRAYFNSFLFGGAFVNGYGYWQPPANYQMLPLGFGLWPACDSAAIPGRFWSAGPCFGAGDYASLAPAAENQYLMGTTPSPFYPPMIFLTEPQAAPPSTKAQPSQPEQKRNMVVCLTDGRQIEVSDWWVAEGKFYFIPVNGPLNGPSNGSLKGPLKRKTQTVELNSLDLQKTIEANEQRGRTFILNFTPPSERPALPALPSNQ